MIQYIPSTRDFATNAAVEALDAANVKMTGDQGPITGTKKFNAAVIANAAFKHRPWADPSHPDFGAVGDGSTDDTTAILNAFDAAVASGARHVRFREGEFAVARQGAAAAYNRALLIAYSNLTVEGVPGATVIKLADGENCTVMRTAFAGVDAEVGVGERLGGITLRNLIIDGNWDNQTWAQGGSFDASGVFDLNGLGIYAVDGAVIDNVEVRNCAHDNVAAASSTQLRFLNPVTRNAGKGTFSLFRCDDVLTVGGLFAEANAAPSGQTSFVWNSDGAACLGASYIPSLTSSATQRNNHRFMSPTVKATNGICRGVLLVNVMDISIHDLDLYIVGQKNAVGITAGGGTVDTDAENIKFVGGRVFRGAHTGTPRTLSAVGGTKAIRDLTMTSMDIIDLSGPTTLVFDTVESARLTDMQVRHTGGDASTRTIDIRGGGDFFLNGGKYSGRIYSSPAPARIHNWGAEFEGAMGGTAPTVSKIQMNEVGRPAANPDTSGATLVQLETEVNQIKAAMRSWGSLTP